MKKKTNKIYKQSGVIPYRIRNGKIQVLLISSRKSQKWVIPKGGICKGMTPPDSAAKEAWEEAGVIGTVNTEKVGAYQYRKRGNVYRVNLFCLPVEKVLEDWPEAQERQRIWLDLHHAAMIVTENSLKKVLESLQGTDNLNLLAQ